MAQRDAVIAVRRVVAVVLCGVLAGAGATACTRDNQRDVSGPRSFPPEPTSTTAGTADAEHPIGGTARVGVWAEPDVGAPHVGGAALRALVYPQLFVAGADGRWNPSLVEPGSDKSATDRRSARFRLRPDAVWSDGTPITVDDLRRTADPRFVADVRTQGAGDEEQVVVEFTQPLPGWRRLWSFTDSVSPPRDGVWGGPFVLAEFTDGLEAVLRRNDRWWGSGPFLDELRLVLVPNWITARQLLARGELDVLMPPAATARERQLGAVADVEVATIERSGWWTGLRLNPAQLDDEARAGLVAAVDRTLFVGTLLKGEATVLNGLAGPEDATWAGVGPGDARGLPPPSDAVDLVGMTEEPMTQLLQRAMQKRARPVSARLELRNAEVERVVLWIAAGEFDAAITLEVDPPEPCWTCRFAGVDESLAREADAGNGAAVAQLQQRLRDEHVLLPLWRHRAVFAWRTGLEGVAPNGYGLSGAWNAWEWWRRP